LNLTRNLKQKGKTAGRLCLNETLTIPTTFQTIQKKYFPSSLNQNNRPVFDAEEINKQEQKEAIERLYR
tara:strand:+ start:466 stop:672 length:207 start_codon:yes stop_codon:yes gene_type:complete